MASSNPAVPPAVDDEFEQALRGIVLPRDIRRSLVLLHLRFLNMQGDPEHGLMVVHRALASEVEQIFAELFAADFPIERMVPVAEFGWSDAHSMAANNTSGFNYRRIINSHRWSQHAYGRAIDVNPVQNPCVRPGSTVPPGAHYDASREGTLTAEGAAVRAFEQRGWEWGGRWTEFRDWHHFQKVEG